MDGFALSHDFCARNISAGYEENLILKDLDIIVPAGKFSVLIGPNGCGKSTLLKSFARLLKPKDRDVVLDGKSI